jgi:hypothetical protein
MKKLNIMQVTIIAIVFLIVCPKGVYAWFNDPKINTRVYPRTNNQIDHSAIADGAGGIIVTWAENMSGVNFDIYTHRLDSHGLPVWPSPVVVCSALSYQGLPKIASDGAGGVIIAWHDSREGMNPTYSNFDIYAQRISGDGQVLWAVDGVPLTTAPEWQVYADIAADGMGGAVVSWDDGRSGDSQIYVQRVDQQGQTLWQQDGVLVADVPYGQSDADIVNDGFGGAIIVWADLRRLGNFDIYAQRVDQSGSRAWGEEGLAIARVPGEQFHTHLSSDGLGGAIFSWADDRTDSGDFDIYVQKVDSGGTIVWPSQGLPVTQVAGSQVINAIISDGSGGAIIAWEDARKGPKDPDIYAQRITSEGLMPWTEGGVPVVTTSEVQVRPALISDGADGAFITWMDFYRGGTWWNVYAQHIDGSGQAKWKQDGIAVSIADKTQANPVIVPDAAGGSIIIWYDSREGSFYNIYAQQVDRQGLLGGGEFKFFTADIDGNPKTVFSPGELILFRSTWTMPAPTVPNTYDATAGMSINSGSAYRQEPITYDVNLPAGTLLPLGNAK